MRLSPAMRLRVRKYPVPMNEKDQKLWDELKALKGGASPRPRGESLLLECRGKRAHKTRVKAERSISKIRSKYHGVGLVAYLCESCGKWHLGNRK